MRKPLFILLFLLACSFAEFRLDSVDVVINIDEKGIAHVYEEMDIVIFGNYSMQLYETGFEENTLASWQKITNIAEIKPHISEKVVDIRNIIVKPQPLKHSISGLNVWYGKIILEYDGFPYFDQNGNRIKGTGIVEMEKYKPRTTLYRVNENALNFKRGEKGNLKIPSYTTLSIVLPPSAKILFVNPLPQNSSKKNTIVWSGVVLYNFVVEYEIEQSLVEEVMEFFTNLHNNISSEIQKPEGIATTVIIFLLLFSYLYLRFSRKR